MYMMPNQQVDFGSIAQDPAIRVSMVLILGVSVIGIQ